MACLTRAVTQVLDPPARDVEERPMDLQASVPDVFRDRRIGQEDLDALLDVHLGDPDGARPIVPDGAELVAVRVAELPERREPGIEDAANAGVAQGGGGAPAGRVAAQHDVLDLEERDRVLDHGRRVDVRRRDDVGNVAVHEDVARLQTQDRRLWAARVGAP
ncbi:hypothetical protein TruAng_011006 [Truncatella angustata]|nr:hypothetical protein TruAng_011006 [Truncatella angustata]